MPQKPGSASSIKTFLAREFSHGDKSWKAGSPQKDAATGAQITEFTNPKTGQSMRVLAFAKAAAVQQDGDTVLIYLETSPSKAHAERKPFEPMLETDADRNAAADRAIDLLMQGGDYDAEMEKAGLAWQNRFCFNYSPDEGWFIVPVKGFTDPNADLWNFVSADDFDFGGLEYDVIGTGTYQFNTKKSPREIADHLLSCGFVFDPRFQVSAGCDRNLVPQAQGPGAGPAPKGP